MKFIDEADEIPEELLNAQKENKLVIFAGAGVSMGEPANLPSFKKLSKKLSEHSNLKIKDNEDIDRFLGRLSDRYKDCFYLHEQVFDFFKNKKTPNHIHNLIIQLFKNRDIKIVTTNFDSLFSIALDEQNIKTEKYYAPALPLGDNFSGLVYLHGGVENNYKNFVLTDKDFSQAYICRGWATNFLKDLFENYYVLFIGYSCNDTILKYLTRGLITKNTYAIVEKNNKDDQHWENLGVKVIKFKNEDFSYNNLNSLLVSWVTYCTDAFLWNRDNIKRIAEQNPEILDPKDLDYLKKYVFKERHLVEYLLKNIKDTNCENWLKWLFENDYISRLFMSKLNCPLNEIDLTLKDWFVRTLVDNENLYGVDDYNVQNKLISKICDKYNYEMSDELAQDLILHFGQNIKNRQIYSFWITQILSSNIAKLPKEHIFLTEQLINCIKSDYKNLANVLILHLFELNMSGKWQEVEYRADSYYLREFYYKNKDIFFNYYDVLLTTISYNLEKCVIKTKIQNDKSCSISLDIRDVEQDIQNLEYSKEIHDLIYILKESLDLMIKENIEKAKGYILKWLNSDIPILTRVGIYGLYSNKILTANQVLNLFIKRKWLLDNYLYMHEVRHYFRINYRFLSDKNKKKLIGAILATMKNESDEELIIPFRFIRYMHDNPKNKNCSILDECYNNLAKKFKIDVDKISRDLDANWYSGGVGGVVTYNYHTSVQEILNLDINSKTLQFLLTEEGEEYIEGECWGKSRRSFTTRIQEVIQKNSTWGLNLFNNLIQRNIYNTDLYQIIFRGFNKFEEIYDKKLFKNLKLLIMQFNDTINLQNLSSSDFDCYIELLSNCLKYDHKNYSNNFIKLIKTSLNIIWDNIDKDETEKLTNEGIFTNAINSNAGNIIRVLLKLLWIEYLKLNKNINIFKNYKNWFNKEIIDNDKDENKSKLGLSILASRLSFLYSFDKNWTKDCIISKLNLNSPDSDYVWSGFLYSSPKFYKELVLDLLPYFDKVIRISKKDFKIRDNSREPFIDFYVVMFLTILIFDKDTDDIEKFDLNLFFENLEDNEISYCYQILKNHLDNEYIKKNIDIYNNWFLKFLQERINLLKSENEKTCIISTIIKFEDIFSDCLNIIRETNFNKFNLLVFHTLNNSSLTDNNPNEVIDFLNLIINKESLKNCYDIYSLERLLKNLSPKCSNKDVLKNILENIIKYCRYNDWAETLLDEIK